MGSWCASFLQSLLMAPVGPDPVGLFLLHWNEGQPQVLQAGRGSSGAVWRAGLLKSCCYHMSLFLVPVNWGELRNERKILKVDSEPLISVGTKCGLGVLIPPVLRSRRPWQDLADGWGSWGPGMLKTEQSGPSGWCLPCSLELVLSEPDWTGAPGDSSSPPHLTGWWPGLQGQRQNL